MEVETSFFCKSRFYWDVNSDFINDEVQLPFEIKTSALY